MEYHTGHVVDQDHDESGVAAWELLRMIEDSEVDVPDRAELAAAARIDRGTLSKIFNGKQPYVRLLLVDRLLSALGIARRLHELTVIPGRFREDAIQMAIYEKLDDNDQLQATEAEIEARADELQDLRFMMLSGAVEASMPPRSVLHS